MTGPREYERLGNAYVGRDQDGAPWVASLLPEGRRSAGPYASAVYFERGRWKQQGGRPASPGRRGEKLPQFVNVVRHGKIIGQRRA